MRFGVQAAKPTWSAAPEDLLVTRQTQVPITGNMVSLPVGTQMNEGRLP
jgi:hypothetical protein